MVSAAALLFCAAVGSLAVSSVASLKEFGVGAALAVIIDATIVRALLVPALMSLIGRANWWAPRPLRRLAARSWGHPEVHVDLGDLGAAVRLEGERGATVTGGRSQS